PHQQAGANLMAKQPPRSSIDVPSIHALPQPTILSTKKHFLIAQNILAAFEIDVKAPPGNGQIQGVLRFAFWRASSPLSNP
ncbi:MAG: hypothetical protein VX500_09585, partial [Planctomycetota bacterium]|nr:hypothetical protein [Planctomycetota bacterium]